MTKTLFLSILSWLRFPAMLLVFAGWLDFPCAADDRFTRRILEEIPPHLHRLIDKGSVKFEQDDRRLQLAMRSALTTFVFRATYDMEFVREQVNADPFSNWQIQVRLTKKAFELRHSIVLGSNFSGQSEADQKLLLHEFDHVAISCDPRVEKLATIILWAPDAWVEPGGNGEPSDDYVQRICEQRFKTRKDWIERMIQKSYDRLDEVSSNGGIEISARSDFFKSLYSKEAIGPSEVAPFRKLLDPLLKSPKYKDVQKYYELLEVP